MDSFMGLSLMMNWESNDLEGLWKLFKQYVEFVFIGLLKLKIEFEKCVFLMIWVGDKG